jgi:O-antigen ligase
MNSYFSHFSLVVGEPESRTEKLRFILLNLFVFFLPFDRFYTTLILYLIIITTILDLSKEKLRSIPHQFWIFQIVFLISVSGYFYSHNKSVGGFLIERQLAILIFPLIIPLAIKITKERINALIITFTISCTLSILILFGYALFSLYEIHEPFSRLFSSTFFNHNFSSPIGIHAGYLSIYISLCLIFILTKYSTSTRQQKVMIAFTLLILTIGLLFLAARNVLIYTVIIVLFVYPFYYVKKKALYFLMSLLIIGSSSLFIINNDFLKNRFSINLLEDINFNKSKQNILEMEPRSQRWLLGIELIKKRPLIGYGTGDEIDNLKIKYKEQGYIISYLESFNAHNQYLSILIKHGIFGLIIFLVAFYYYFKSSIQSNSFMYFVFLFGICFSFLTENVLDSNKGIFFFAIFNTIFGYYALLFKKEV